MKLYHVFNAVVLVTYLSCIPIVFSSLSSTSITRSTTNQEEVMESLLTTSRHLQDDESHFKCKSNSKLEMQIETLDGGMIPFYCNWVKMAKGYNYTCGDNGGAIASHCPSVCGTCSTYRCADSKANFLWKEKTRSCGWLAGRSPSSTETLCKNIKLASTCRATCQLCAGPETRWKQTGQDLYSNVDNRSSFGYSLSMSADATTIAIGAPTAFFGEVRVYKQNNSTERWKQIGQDIVSESGFASFGISVSLSDSGRRVAIGAPGHYGPNGISSGHVQVYEYDEDFINGTWVQLGEDIDGDAYYDSLGSSVSFSSDGNIVAIGAPSFNRDGHVRVYGFDNSSWVQIGEDIDGEDMYYEKSGFSVSLSDTGRRVAIGAPGNFGTNGDNSGHVRVYEYDESSKNGTWVQLGQDIDGEDSDDRSGTRVSLSGDGNTVAIGAPYADGDKGYYGVGHVRIYGLDNSTWVQIGEDIDGDSGDGRSGSSVSISADGNRVALGAPRRDNGTGYASVYEYDKSSKAWEQVGEGIAGKGSEDYHGVSVTMSADGKTVAVGAANSFNADSDYVRIFRDDQD